MSSQSPTAKAILNMLSSVCVPPNNNSPSTQEEEFHSDSSTASSLSQFSRSPSNVPSRQILAKHHYTHHHHHPNHGQIHHHHKPFNTIAPKSVIAKRRLSDVDSSSDEQQQQYNAYSTTLKKIQDLRIRSTPRGTMIVSSKSPSSRLASSSSPSNKAQGQQQPQNGSSPSNITIIKSNGNGQNPIIHNPKLDNRHINHRPHLIFNINQIESFRNSQPRMVMSNQP
ncbi:unnamed protein product [Ambrosiozyma monospora]|uniref:Unnamed protein product n=1 Tax=Ambrosiozyma monospora TaxID=43982 RepID=A0ACB5T0J7_AMBMO|nr:unnamed protein product [Ambrosiozyma monospora]